ncbi:MAG: dihydrofolate reductase family protein [Sphingobacterium sp.]
MRKLKLQMQISVDGFNSTGPEDEQKWVTWAWEEIKQDVLRLARSCDTELIGRKLAIDYIPYWNDVLEDSESTMFEVALIKSEQKKIVFTKTLKESKWENTQLASGDLIDEINNLKKQPGKDIIVYGGSSFAGNLLKENLIDEFFLYLNPIALGEGIPLFECIKQWQKLKLIDVKAYSSGIVLLHYERL